MPKLILLIIGLLAMTNAITYAKTVEAHKPLAAEAEYGRMVKEIAVAITPKGMM